MTFSSNTVSFYWSFFLSFFLSFKPIGLFPPTPFLSTGLSFFLSYYLHLIYFLAQFSASYFFYKKGPRNFCLNSFLVKFFLFLFPFLSESSLLLLSRPRHDRFPLSTWPCNLRLIMKLLNLSPQRSLPSNYPPTRWPPWVTSWVVCSHPATLPFEPTSLFLFHS